MYKYTSVPTGNLDQRWRHGIWVGKASMTDERHIVLTENGIQNGRSLHRVPPEERFVISEFQKVRGLLWNGRAENLKATIVTWQDQGPSGVARHGPTPGCSGCVGLGPHTEACRVRLEKALADERADPAETPIGPITEPATESQESAPAMHSRSQRLHHPVLLRRCQHKTFRTSRWIHRRSWEHKNAESAKEHGQARRQQVKSLEDQW